MKYPVFLQALALTIVVILIGMYIGISMEQGNFEKMNEYYVGSEIMLLDVMALDSLITTVDVSCDELEQSSVNLLNKIYEESIILDDYEAAGKMTKTLDSVHNKYSALRGYLWIDSIKIKEKCGDVFNTVVYLYNYNEEDLTKKAEQNVWSKVLFEIKEENDENVLLIPIAADIGIESVKLLMAEYGVETLPAVVINEKDVFSVITNIDEIRSKLY